MRISNIFNVNDYFKKNPENVVDFGKKELWKLVNIFKDGSCKSLLPFNGDYKDYATNQNLTLVSGSPTYNNFENRKSLYFNGNTYFSIPQVLTNLPMTISVWVNTSQKQSGEYNWGNPTILGIATPGSGSHDFGIENKDGYIHIFSGFGVEDYYTTNKFIADGNWHNIIVQFYTDKYEVYCDNSLIVTRNQNDTQISSCSNKWYIGIMIKNCSGYVSNSNLNETNLANLRVFNRNLSSDEINYLYKNKC
jgi:hypothetical protein